MLNLAVQSLNPPINVIHSCPRFKSVEEFCNDHPSHVSSQARQSLPFQHASGESEMGYTRRSSRSSTSLISASGTIQRARTTYVPGDNILGRHHQVKMDRSLGPPRTHPKKFLPLYSSPTHPEAIKARGWPPTRHMESLTSFEAFLIRLLISVQYARRVGLVRDVFASKLPPLRLARIHIHPYLCTC